VRAHRGTAWTARLAAPASRAIIAIAWCRAKRGDGDRGWGRWQCAIVVPLP